MNCIIDQQGFVIGLMENIVDLLPFEYTTTSTVKGNSFTTGLPSIFPINHDLKEIEFKNLQLKKNVGLFNTRRDEPYIHLKIQKFALESTLPNFLCSLRFSENINSTSDDNKTQSELNNHRISKDSFIKLIEGSVFTINNDGVVSSIIQDGSFGIIIKHNLQLELI